MKYINALSVGIGLTILSASVSQAQIEFSSYKFDSVDLSGLGASGGVINATYKLEVGDTDPGLGDTIVMDFTFGAWGDTDMTYTGGDTATNSYGTIYVDYDNLAGPTFPVGTSTATVTIEDVPTDGLSNGWQHSSDHVGFASSNSTSSGGGVQLYFDPTLESFGTTRTLTYVGTDLDEDGSTNRSSKGDISTNLFSPAAEIVYAKSVPEPSSTLLVSFSVICLSLRRRR